jgi:TolA-binding protein
MKYLWSRQAISGPLGACVLFLAGAFLGNVPRAVCAEKPATAKSTPDALNLYADAASFQNNNAFELAAEEWEKFLKLYPNDPLADKARHYAGVCQMQLKQFARAAEHFAAVVAKGREFELAEDARLNLAWSQYSLGGQGQKDQYSQAVDSFAALAKEFPQGKYLDQALYYRGEALYALGRKTEAAAAYRELIDNRFDSPLKCDALYALGVTCEEARDYAEATRLYDRFLDGCASNDLVTEVRLRKAEIVLQQGNPAQAEKLFAELAKTPNFPEADRAALRQAFCAAAQEAFPRAAGLYAQVIEKYPRSKYASEARLSAGRCYYRAEQFEDAAKWLRSVAEGQTPDALEAAHWVCRIELRNQDPRQAAELAERVLAKNLAGDFLVQLKLDRADALYAQAERRAEAVEAYLEIAAQNADHALTPQALYNAAFGLWEIEKYTEGLQQAQQFVGKFPQHALVADVRHIAAECELKLGRPAEAEAAFRGLIASHAEAKQVPLWRIRLGLTLYLQKKYAEAVTELQALLPSLQDRTHTAEAQFLVGISQFQLDQLPQAEEALTASRQADPSWRQADEALLFLSRVRFKSGRVDEALATARQLLNEFPQSSLLDQTQYRLGEYAYGKNDFPAAIAAHDALLARWPGSAFAPYALNGKGWALLKDRQYAAAAEAFSTLMSQYAQHELVAGAHLARATCRRHLKQYPEALRDIDDFLRSNPPTTARADAIYERGLCEAGSENYAAAIQTLEQLLKDHPQFGNTAGVLYELAWAYKKTNQDAESVAAFTRLANEFGDTVLAAEANWRMGENHFDKGEYDQAVKLYTVAKDQAPPGEVDELATHKLGWALFQLKDYDGALKQFHQQTQAYPQGALYADALFMEGECQFKLAHHKEAMTILRNASQAGLAKPEMQVLALLHAGQSAAELKQWKESIRLLDDIITKHADSPYLGEAHGKRGWAKQNLKQIEDAVADYEEAATRSRGEAGAHARFLLGEVKFERKEFSDAIKSFQRVMYGYGAEQAPPEVKHWQAMAGYEAGRCAEVQIEGASDPASRTKLIADAKTCFQYVVQRHPDHELVLEAKQRLAALEKLQE